MNTARPSERLDRRLSLLTADGLRIDATTDPNDALLATFFAGYDRAFVLANEKEGLDGFVSCLALNQAPHYAALRNLHGPFREVVFVATDRELAAVVGGANFIAYPVASAGGPVLCANLNYVYCEPALRRRGHLRRLVAAVGEVMLALFPASDRADPMRAGGAPLIFIEQNDPLRLSAEQYAHDTEHSGIDQVDRIGIWTKLGARILDFPYVQPPLSAQQEADRTLLYAVLGTSAASLEPAVLREHLRRFFAISVLKGNDPDTDPTAAEQFALLDQLAARGAPIPLLDPSAWLRGLPPGGSGERLRSVEGEASLLDVLRRLAAT